MYLNDQFLIKKYEIYIILHLSGVYGLTLLKICMMAVDNCPNIIKKIFTLIECFYFVCMKIFVIFQLIGIHQYEYIHKKKISDLIIFL